MRKCKDKLKAVTMAAVCFGAGVLLALFLPPIVTVCIEALLICAVGILFIL